MGRGRGAAGAEAQIFVPQGEIELPPEPEHEAEDNGGGGAGPPNPNRPFWRPDINNANEYRAAVMRGARDRPQGPSVRNLRDIARSAARMPDLDPHLRARLARANKRGYKRSLLPPVLDFMNSDDFRAWSAGGD